MYKEILFHKQYISECLATSRYERDDYRQLYDFHCQKVHDFQHERHIHLLVTFFFAFLTVMTLVGLIASPIVALLPCLVTLLAILAVLDGAYVWHYYHLENGVQSLYPLTKALFDKMQK